MNSSGETLKEIARHKNSNGIKKQKENKSKNPCWNEDDLKKLERCVSILGTDFDIISKMFKNRTRKQIMNKYKKSTIHFKQQYRDKFYKIQSELKRSREVERHRFASVDTVDFDVAVEINALFNTDQQEIE